jgi:uncharacterized protein DUF6286
VRTVNRVLAVSLALMMAAGGFVVAVVILLAGIGRGSWVVPYDDWYDSARRNQWESSGPRWLFIALCAVGLAVLVLQAVKPAPRSVALQQGRSDAGVSRRTLEQALARTAGRIDGVAAAKATVDRDRARIIVETNRRTGDLRPPVEQAVQDHLERVSLARPPKVVVAVKRTR